MRIIHNVLNKYEQLDFLAKISLINEKLDSKLYGRNINILFDVYFEIFWSQQTYYVLVHSLI